MTASSERRLVAALALFGAARVLVFATAFPFFNGVDEHQHFDAIAKYAQGRLPGPGRSYLSRETAEAVLLFGSPEYLRKSSEHPSGRIPTPQETRAKRPQGSPRYETMRRELESRESLQFSGPPLYYGVAALWRRIGSACGVQGLAALYWIRVLNGLVMGSVVLLAWRLLAPRFPDDAFLRLGVPALVAFFPNDLFYSISNDVLSALLGTGAFALLVRLSDPGGARWSHFGAAGLLVAAAFLNKFPNLVFGVVAGAIALRRLVQAHAARRLRGELVCWSAFAAAALLPIAVWLGRNLLVVGSLTGQHHKVDAAGWVPKSFSAMPEHPIFTAAGAGAFLRELFLRFWRGELWWKGAPMELPALDAFYALSSPLLLGVAAGVLARRAWQRRSRAIEVLALATVVGVVAVLGAISVYYDFGTRSRPSNAFPFVIAGRYIIGVLVPFAILYLEGLRAVLGWLPGRASRVAPWLALAAVAGAALAGEIAVSRDVFASAYNAYHWR